MQTKEFIKKELPILFLVLFPMLYLFLVWGRLPDELPLQWNVNGDPTFYAPKYVMGLIIMGIYGLMLILPDIDSRKKSYELFLSTYFRIRVFIIMLMSFFYSLTITEAIGYNVEFEKTVHIAIVLLLTILGYYMPSIKRNWLLGVKTPWTLSSRQVWNRTHKLTGKIWVVSGVLLFLFSFFMEGKLYYSIFFGVIVIMIVVPVAYSYIIYKLERSLN